jgi:hypothetical protein
MNAAFNGAEFLVNPLCSGHCCGSHFGLSLFSIMDSIIHKIIVAITREGHIPDLLKTGLLTPIFKNKGSKLHVTNYRGITVTPVVIQ